MKNILLSIFCLILAVLSFCSIDWLAVSVFGDVDAAIAAIESSDAFAFGGGTVILIFTSFLYVKFSISFLFDYFSICNSRPGRENI